MFITETPTGINHNPASFCTQNDNWRAGGAARRDSARSAGVRAGCCMSAGVRSWPVLWRDLNVVRFIILTCYLLI